MLKAFATIQHRRVTLAFLAVFCLAAIGTVTIGLDGNTPALALAFVAATALVLALVHPWRRAREFKYLVYASGLGFAVFVITFLAAIFVCPPAFVIGLAGVLIMFFRRRKGREPEPL